MSKNLNEYKILLIDDEEDLCFLLSKTLEKQEFHGRKVSCTCGYSLSEAKEIFNKNYFDLVITDVNLGVNQSGLEFVSHIKNQNDKTPVIVMSAYGSQDLSLMALKLGAFDFVNKPIQNEKLFTLIDDALKPQINNDEKDKVINRLIGCSEKIVKFKKYISRLSQSQAPVFIRGESGTGKEVVARILHDLSSRSDGNFVAINCGAIPEHLLESELFGYKKGSFTGALSDKDGLIKKADNGTLFLDEVAELPLNMQVKLLRAIQEKKIRPVGGDEISVDFRLISATHQNVQKMVSENLFRSDLFYRLCVMDISIPPLRERENDVILLADFYCKKICTEWGIPQKVMSADFKKWLLTQSYDGNVRELINIMQRAISLADGCEIKHADYQEMEFEQDNNPTSDGVPIGHDDLSAKDGSDIFIPNDLENYLDTVDKKIVLKVFEEYNGSQPLIAERLGLTMRQLRYRLKKYNIIKE